MVFMPIINKAINKTKNTITGIYTSLINNPKIAATKEEMDKNTINKATLLAYASDAPFTDPLILIGTTIFFDKNVNKE